MPTLEEIRRMFERPQNAVDIRNDSKKSAEYTVLISDDIDETVVEKDSGNKQNWNCPDCGGLAKKIDRVCHTCNSTGVVGAKFMVKNSRIACMECSGTGHDMHGLDCNKCNGVGHIQKDKMVAGAITGFEIGDMTMENCKTCNGVGEVPEFPKGTMRASIAYNPMVPCPKCKGHGNILRAKKEATKPQLHTCPDCDGTGEFFKGTGARCASCNGTGHISITPKETKLSKRIKAIKADQRFTISMDGRDALMKIGKHRGKMLSDLVENSYMEWIIKEDFPNELKDVCRYILDKRNGKVPKIKVPKIPIECSKV